ncbi:MULTISPECIES: DegT/DnrJ/EryC1/StrS aminotransferase family protein [unclassified Halomonas]|uniref:DegT/DnrJ/EryC1/StrS family aminotransferase n=1 Tax=unclassified Halomonas TaxID=2609666 RepID=UPI002885A90E|nr:MULTISPECIES: DegT/DnrJ/EryC1/StrS aminotransferase family protein [unclassified Halomonas]MDT0499427.1 DegT/DnrJ/EryC1/StrS aminotransferase family protein [Halomonas sp. PAR7]MDT0510756.1 DegT/DnrJ/EryC1/StrS aminotransferase family protein [Halomonas sp. LES1]MDT0591715.1 DegT/DnrJ/EryC1/StrS aminotransferase family protein [Halomonas sp. PAR8]
MLDGPFPPWPSYTQEEADAVTRALMSNRVNYWTGQECRQFEREFAGYVGVQHAIAVANGTNALDLALKALDIGPGDEVIVTSRTFLASASSIVNAGASPIFADIDRDSQNITAATVAPLITPRTRAIIAVHLAGWPCEMDELRALANDNHLALIEDCAQAHGARYHGNRVGSLGDIAAWSFCQDKIMTTGGEGGMVTTQNSELWQRMWAYKDHGKSWSAVYERQHPAGFRWLHESIGTNWRLTEMQAAIGRIQLGRMPEWKATRQAHARRIWNTAQELPGLRVPHIPAYIDHAAYKCYLFVEPEHLKAGWDRDRILHAIVSQGVPCFSGSCSEVYREKAFGPRGDHPGWHPATRRPVARELGDTSLMFLCHPTLGAAELDRTCDVLESVMREACQRRDLPNGTPSL